MVVENNDNTGGLGARLRGESRAMAKQGGRTSTLITIYSEIETETALNGPYFAPTQAFYRGTRRGTRQFQHAKTTKTTVVVVAVRKS